MKPFHFQTLLGNLNDPNVVSHLSCLKAPSDAINVFVCNYSTTLYMIR